MKKLFLLSLMLVSATTFAQFYASLGAGYSIGMPKRVLGIEKTFPTSAKNIYGTYGTGVNGKLNLGYFLNDNLGVELGFTYLMGSEQLIEASVSEESSEKINAKTTFIGLAPTLIYKSDNGLYVKFGFATKVGGKMTEEKTEHHQVGLYTLDILYVYEVKGKMPLGYRGALGYEYRFNHNMGLYFELDYLGINVKKDKATLTEYNSLSKNPDGIVIERTIDDIPLDEREIIYVDKLNNTSPENHRLTKILPYSSLGFNVGIRYSFGK